MTDEFFPPEALIRAAAQHAIDGQRSLTEDMASIRDNKVAKEIMEIANAFGDIAAQAFNTLRILEEDVDA